MKTKEELNALKTEVEELNAKLSELSEEELKEVAGGDWYDFRSALCSGKNTVTPNGFIPVLPIEK